MEPDRAVWVDNDWDLTGDVFQAGEFVELRLARADLGSPDVVALHMSMVNETNLAEGTFAGAPAISFADGYDPDYGHHFEFDLLGSGPPFAAVPSP
jgi:hypothetical protein